MSSEGWGDSPSFIRSLSISGWGRRERFSFVRSVENCNLIKWFVLKRIRSVSLFVDQLIIDRLKNFSSIRNEFHQSSGRSFTRKIFDLVDRKIFSAKFPFPSLFVVHQPSDWRSLPITGISPLRCPSSLCMGSLLVREDWQDKCLKTRMSSLELLVAGRIPSVRKDRLMICSLNSIHSIKHRTDSQTKRRREKRERLQSFSIVVWLMNLQGIDWFDDQRDETDRRDTCDTGQQFTQGRAVRGRRRRDSPWREREIRTMNGNPVPRSKLIWLLRCSSLIESFFSKSLKWS